MTLVLLILVAAWIAVLLFVVACCVSAARGDAALMRRIPPVDPRQGRFARDPHRSRIARVRQH